MILKQSDYTFNAAAKTVTFLGDFASLEFQQIELITNVVDDIIIYQFNKPTKGGTYAAPILTLTFDTTAMSNGDALMIVVGGDATAANQTSQITQETALNTVTGLQADAAVDTDTTGTISGKLRGLVKLFVNFLTRLPASLAASGGLKVDIAGTGANATAIKVDGSAVTQPVSGTVSISGGGDATAANQATEIAALATLNAKDFATQTTLALVKAKTDNIPPLGQALAAASTPVVLTAIQQAALTPPAAITGYNLEATQLLVKAKTDNIDVALSTRLKPADTLTAVALNSDVRQSTASNLNMTEASAAAILAKVTAGAASMVKLEDVASADGDGGTPAMAVRKATPANTSGTDGDYEMLQMANGKLWVQAGATYKPSYGTPVSMTVTVLTTLANSATVGWQSDRVSNLSTLATDYEIMVSAAGGASSSDKAIYVMICPWYYDGASWYAASGGTTTLPSGSVSGYTIASPNNFRLLGVLNYIAATSTVQDTFLLSNAFGSRLPDGWSLIITNFSGAALTTATVKYTPINDIMV